jgi:hypothetical protein
MGFAKGSDLMLLVSFWASCNFSIWAFCWLGYWSQNVGRETGRIMGIRIRCMIASLSNSSEK